MLVTMVDRDHFVWLKYSIISLKKTNPDVVPNILLVNCGTRHIKSIKKINSKARILTFNGSVYKCNHQSLSQFKTVAIKRFLKYSNKEPILWADADCIYLGKLNDLFRKISKYDLTVKVQDPGNVPREIYIKRRFNAGVIGFRNSKKVINFINKWHEFVWSDLRSRKDWCKKQHDQGRLYLTYLLNKKNISLFRLPEEYNTIFYKNKPKIWHLMVFKKNREKAVGIIKKLLSV